MSGDERSMNGWVWESRWAAVTVWDGKTEQLIRTSRDSSGKQERQKTTFETKHFPTYATYDGW
jgi:hypothetical protein